MVLRCLQSVAFNNSATLYNYVLSLITVINIREALKFQLIVLQPVFGDRFCTSSQVLNNRTSLGNLTAG